MFEISPEMKIWVVNFVFFFFFLVRIGSEEVFAERMACGACFLKFSGDISEISSEQSNDVEPKLAGN